MSQLGIARRVAECTSRLEPQEKTEIWRRILSSGLRCIGTHDDEEGKRSAQDDVGIDRLISSPSNRKRFMQRRWNEKKASDYVQGQNMKSNTAKLSVSSHSSGS